MDTAFARERSNGKTSSSHLQAYARRTLDFLHLIETTVNSLGADTAVIRIYAKDVQEAAARLARHDGSDQLDTDGRIAKLLELAAEASMRLHADAADRCESARNDPSLNDDDGVVDAFCSYMEALATYHNAVEDMRDTLGTVDALRSPVVGSFTDVKELLKALDS